MPPSRLVVVPHREALAVHDGRKDTGATRPLPHAVALLKPQVMEHLPKGPTLRQVLVPGDDPGGCLGAGPFLRPILHMQAQ